MRNKWNLLVYLLILAGGGLLMYPVVSSWLWDKNHSRVIEEYQITAEELSENQLNEEFERAHAYNQTLFRRPVTDPFAAAEFYDEEDEYFSILNMDGTMGYITIPVIDAELPMHHTTSEPVLKKGVGHLKGSAFPVGGEGSHTVLSAHRGLPSAKLFTDLDKLEKGDVFSIHVLNQTLTYEVVQILETEPEDTEALQAVPGKDYVTLLTCTPYAINSHRLMVRGERTEVAEDEPVMKKAVRGRMIWIGIFFGTALCGTGLVKLIRSRKRSNKLIK